MLVQSEEKKMLIESMKKLTGHVAGNPQRQKDIFSALSLHDFNKIVSNLKDENEYLRRISALFLCELFYRNPDTKAGAVKLLNLQPKWGRQDLSGWDSLGTEQVRINLKKYADDKRECIELMRSQVREQEDDKICWVINLERKTLKIELLEYKKYSSFTFIDPSKHIFGYTVSRSEQQIKASNVPQRSPERIVDSAEKRYSMGSHKVEERILRGSLDHYQEERQRSKEREMPAKYSLNMTMNHLPERKISASSRTQGPVSYKNQLVNHHSSKKQDNPTRPITSDAVRQTKPSYKNSLLISPKISFTEGESRLTNSRQLYQNQQINTDRSSPYRKSTNKTPSSAREGFREQDKFYKRVKDIIRK